MSTVVGRAFNVVLIKSADPIGAEGVAADTALPLHCAFFDFDNAGLAVAAGDTLTCLPAAAIQNSRRDGRTVTLISIAMAGNMMRLSKTLTMKTLTLTAGGITTVTAIPAEEDYTTTTDGDIAAAVILNRPFEFLIAYSES